jgi:hypothetical protein
MLPATSACTQVQCVVPSLRHSLRLALFSRGRIVLSRFHPNLVLSTTFNLSGRRSWKLSSGASHPDPAVGFHVTY